MEGITDFVTGAFRGQTLDRLCAQLNETPGAIQEGIAQAVPLSLAGVAERAQSQQGANELLGRIRDDSYPRLDANQLAQTVTDPVATQGVVHSSMGFLNGSLGNKLGRIVDGVRGTSGLSQSSASTLLGLVTPMVLGWIGSKVTSKGLDARGLSRLLADEGHKVSGKLPAGFSSVFAESARERRETRRDLDDVRAQRAHRAPDRRRSNWPWLLAALVALGAILLWWSSARRNLARLNQVEAPVVATREVRHTPITAAPRAGVTSVEPPNTEIQPVAGTDLTALRQDAAPLKTFLESGGSTPRRFVLEGIRFDSAGTNVSPNAMLNELARVIAAHPTAHVSIEGHTDATGDPASNQKLSQQRADAVRLYLIRQATPAKQLTAIGKAATNPIGDNASSNGRAQNRRVELVVTQL